MGKNKHQVLQWGGQERTGLERDTQVFGLFYIYIYIFCMLEIDQNNNNNNTL